MKDRAPTSQDTQSTVAAQAAEKQSSDGEALSQIQDNRASNIQQMKLLQNVEGSTGLPSAADHSVQLVEKGDLVGFKTVSMGTAGSALNHQFTWQSSTGDLKDLSHVKTRELVEWDAPPPEFGGTGAYAGAGKHNGLAETLGSAGQGADNHDIIPAQGFPAPGKKSFLLDGDGTSQTWTLRQAYQMSVDGGEWVNIPGTNYVLTRWFERSGNDLIGYMSKRGLDDGQMHRAIQVGKDWYL